MKTIQKLFGPCSLVLLTIGLLALATPPAHAGGVGTVDAGVTNATLPFSTGTATLGQSDMTIDQQNAGSLLLSGSTATTNAATVTVDFKRKYTDGSETDQVKWTCTLPASGATSFRYVTNLPPDYVGAASSIVLVSITNNNGNAAITNPAVKLEKKRLQAPN